MAAPDVAREVRYYMLHTMGVEIQLLIGRHTEIEANLIKAQTIAKMQAVFSEVVNELQAIDPGIVVRLH